LICHGALEREHPPEDVPGIGIVLDHQHREPSQLTRRRRPCGRDVQGFLREIEGVLMARRGSETVAAAGICL
jgi:hypothetical protein